MNSTGPQVFIETYGCQMNVADTELMLGILRDAGYRRAESAATADVILVNTCAVREHAEQRVWGRLAQLGRLKRRSPELVIGVTGCMAKHVGDKLTGGAAAVDVLASADAYRRLPDLIAAARDRTQLSLHLDRREDYVGIDPVRAPGVNGWVTIMRGCDRFCSFCVVPYVRGRERSVPAPEVLRQVRELATSGFVEVTLLGQTVNAYRDGDVTFAALLARVAQAAQTATARTPAAATPGGIRRIRFTSPHPVDFDQATLAVMASSPAIMKHVHLPVQSGADRVLAAMRRGHTRRDFLRLVESMRARMPDITFTTDLIVGFPGETRDDFAATLDLVREVGFESAFMFRYSERAGTIAARERPDTVGSDEKARRLEELIALQESISAARNRAWEGRTVEVLVEGRSRRDAAQLFGRSEHAKTVIFPGTLAAAEEAGDAGGAGDTVEAVDTAAVRAGDLVDVRIERSTAHTLFGSRAAAAVAGRAARP